MAGEDHERRISTVEANIYNFGNSLQRVENYLEKLFNQTGSMDTKLALVINNQDDMKKYQVKCDLERHDLDKRLTECEGFQGRITKFAMIITGIASLISPQLSKIWERIFS